MFEFFNDIQTVSFDIMQCLKWEYFKQLGEVWILRIKKWWQTLDTLSHITQPFLHLICRGVLTLAKEAQAVTFS